ncbi:MAG: aminotransferase class I/II-fold pyridoxal phosphate-dependent enzyme [Marinifilaceae bacterium]
MQALILAAGMGKRLQELTHDNTKCMVKVNGCTLIERMLDSLNKLQINKIIIVVGFQASNLKEYLGTEYNGMPIEYVENKDYAITNNIYSLGIASDHLLQDDTILLESDLIYDDEILSKLYNHPEPNLVAVAKFESWMDGSVVTIDEDNVILDLISKKSFNYNNCNDYYKTINIYKFSKEFSRTHFIPFLKAYINAVGVNEYYEQVLRIIVMLDNPDIKALPIKNEKWYEIDDIQDLDIASVLFAEGDERVRKMHQRYGGFWRFPELLDYCYLVNPFFPTSKMREDMMNSFNVLLTEYPSGLNINRLLAGKFFQLNQEHILIGNGAAELINILCEYVIKGNVGVIIPTFEEYTNRLKGCNVEYFKPQNEQFYYNVDDIISYYSKTEIDWLLLINPDNPSGNLILKDDMERLIDWTAENGIKLIIDESFIDFSVGEQSVMKNFIIDKYPNLIFIKSISKSFGVPGIRLGILASSDVDVLDKIRTHLSIWNINSFGEYFMQIIGKYHNDYKAACSQFISERERFKKLLDSISFLETYPSQANYFLCRIKDRYSSKELMRILLLADDILIKDCSSKLGFEGKNYIRLAVRSKADNDKLIESLSRIDSGNI